MKVRTILFIAAAVACAFTAPAALASPAEQVVLRQSVTVEDKVILLGDLFTGAGENAKVAVAYAPAPGTRAIFDSQWLYRVAHAYGLAWRPMSLQDQVTVQRASTAIGRDEIESRILEALAADGVSPTAQVELSNHMFRIYVAEGINTRIGVEDMVFDPRTRRFNTVIVAAVEGSGVQRFRVAGQVFEVTEVPVVTRRILPGDIIKDGDIETLSVRADHLPRNAIVEIDQLIGKSPKRTPAPGPADRHGRRPGAHPGSQAGPGDHYLSAPADDPDRQGPRHGRWCRRRYHPYYQCPEQHGYRGGCHRPLIRSQSTPSTGP